VAYDRVLVGWMLAVGAAFSALLLLNGGAPFPYDPRVIANAPHPLAGLVVAALALFYLLSLGAFLSLHGHAREEETERTASTARTAPRLKRAA
jgi:hypothetical protein